MWERYNEFSKNGTFSATAGDRSANAVGAVPAENVCEVKTAGLFKEQLAVALELSAQIAAVGV